MNKNKSVIYILVILFTVVLFSKNIVVFAGNIMSILRKDNRETLKEEMYNIKIDNIQRELSNYEKAYDKYKLYDSKSYILAKTAIRKIYDFYDYIIIAPTSRINNNAPVINEDGLVGIVASSTDKTGKVNLLTGIKNLSVRISSSYGLLNGYDIKDKLLIVKNINNYEEIKVGDKVYTSGLESIQDNLLIGEVVKTHLEGVERIVYVKSAVDFDNINYVYVINWWYYFSY